MKRLQEQIGGDWKVAMKERDPKKAVLSLILTELKNKAIASRKSGDTSTAISDEAAIKVIFKMAKQRKESILSYKKGGRNDLVEQESVELAILENYLPKMLSEAETKELVVQAVDNLCATSLKEMGKVMGHVLSEGAGRVDAKVVQKLVRELLG